MDINRNATIGKTKLYKRYGREHRAIDINSGANVNFMSTRMRINTELRSDFPSFSILEVLCDFTDFSWKYGTPFHAMTGRTAIFRLSPSLGFPQGKCQKSAHSPRLRIIIIPIISR